MSLRGNIGTLRALEETLRALPSTITFEVASASAAEITRLAHTTFEAGQNAYGDEWPLSKDGKPVRLRRTGRLADFGYVAIGTKLRSRLGPQYSIYQVGQRPILPRNGARLPIAYAAVFKANTAAIIESKLKGATR